MTTEQPVTKTCRQRLTLLALVTIFVLPIILAVGLYLNPQSWRPGTTNYGKLVTPQMSVKDISLTQLDGTPIKLTSWEGKWLFLTINPEQCTNTCIDNLYKMRQIKIALGKKSEQLVNVFALPKAKITDRLFTQMQQDYPNVTFLTIDEPALMALQTQLPPDTIIPSDGGLYAVDPNRNIVMYFPNKIPASSILKDMQRLVRG